MENPEKCLLYEFGVFTEMDTPWGQNEDWGVAFGRLGLVDMDTLGCDVGISCQIFGGDEDLWVVVLSDGCRNQAIVIRRFIDLFDLLNRYAPLMIASKLNSLEYLAKATRDTLHPEIRRWMSAD